MINPFFVQFKYNQVSSSISVLSVSAIRYFAPFLSNNMRNSSLKLVMQLSRINHCTEWLIRPCSFSAVSGSTKREPFNIAGSRIMLGAELEERFPIATVNTITITLLPRCMECRRGLAMGILSVRPSVCPSVKRVHCDKTEENSVQIFIPCDR